MIFIQICLWIFLLDLRISCLHLELDMVYEQKERGEGVKNMKNTVKKISNKDVKEKCTETEENKGFIFCYQGVVVEIYKTNINRDHQSPSQSFRQ